MKFIIFLFVLENKKGYHKAEFTFYVYNNIKNKYSAHDYLRKD